MQCILFYHPHLAVLQMIFICFNTYFYLLILFLFMYVSNVQVFCCTCTMTIKIHPSLQLTHCCRHTLVVGRGTAVSGFSLLMLCVYPRRLMLECNSTDDGRIWRRTAQTSLGNDWKLQTLHHVVFVFEALALSLVWVTLDKSFCQMRECKWCLMDFHSTSSYQLLSHLVNMMLLMNSTDSLQLHEAASSFKAPL